MENDMHLFTDNDFPRGGLERNFKLQVVALLFLFRETWTKYRVNKWWVFRSLVFLESCFVRLAICVHWAFLDNFLKYP